MSRETIAHLNTQTLIGFTAKRGNAWHYRAEEQGAESNHYTEAVPVEDVRRRLFAWDALARPLFVSLPADIDTMSGIGDDGMPYRSEEVPGRKAIVRSDSGAVLGIHSDGYAIHQYDETLIGTVARILDDGLSIGSAGLLRNGAQAWVSVEVPDTITTPEGVAFRPNLLAVSSLDGSLASTFKRVVTNVVCDNTMHAGLGEAGQQYKIKHTRNSRAKIATARDALGIVHRIADDFAEEVRALCATEVNARQWGRFVEEFAPLEPGTTGRGRTMALNKRNDLNRLWKSDARVSPWAGTAWGVVQAVNTYTHHEGIVRGAGRAERNMTRAVSGGVEKLDIGTAQMLTKVLALA